MRFHWRLRWWAHSVTPVAFLLLIANFPSDLIPTAAGQTINEIKSLAFNDPNTNYIYHVTQNRVEPTDVPTHHRDSIRVTRFKRNDTAAHQPIGPGEHVQTIPFDRGLVDFDLECMPEHCYLVVVTSSDRQNIRLYSWQRVTFDELARRDSYAKPNAVTLFRIEGAFYIVVAQEQLHLTTSTRPLIDSSEAPFVGAAVLKFSKGQESRLRYNQFIRLPYNPVKVIYFTGNAFGGVLSPAMRPIDHYIIFLRDSRWSPEVDLLSSSSISSYLWSRQSDYFLPYRFPRGARLDLGAGPRPPIVLMPPSIQLPPFVGPSPTINLTAPYPVDRLENLEACFNILHRFVADRELYASKLIESSHSLWRLSRPGAMGQPPMIGSHANELKNISAKVVVHGNVIVHGSFAESPQVTLIGGPIFVQDKLVVSQLSSFADAHSPALVEYRLRQADLKLRHIREKLERAASLNGPITELHSPVRFFGPVRANELIFDGAPIANSDVRLNGVPFYQLEHQLLRLRGPQTIGAKFTFEREVTADLLEIHGEINEKYFLRDAFNIHGQQLQVVNMTHQMGPNVASLIFRSISAPEIVMSYDAAVNNLRLADYITHDDRPQIITGRKTFERIHADRLALASSSVLLNDRNISRLALSAIRLAPEPGRSSAQYLTGDLSSFRGPVTVDRLVLNRPVNNFINVSLLIHESVKRNDVTTQKLTGPKRFLAGLKVRRLTTEGAINGVQINQIFNLNDQPPLADYDPSFFNSTPPAPISQEYEFTGPVFIEGNLEVGWVNGRNLRIDSIRRAPPGVANHTVPPQVVHGRKIFSGPVRVSGSIEMLNQFELQSVKPPLSPLVHPTVNGFDPRQINTTLRRLMQDPPAIAVTNLTVLGNLNLPLGDPKVIFGDSPHCPLDVIRSRLILDGVEEQQIGAPVEVGALHLRSAKLNQHSAKLNEFKFPQDFVLRYGDGFSSSNGGAAFETVFGHKTFESLVLSPHDQLPSVLRSPGSNRLPIFDLHQQLASQPNIALKARTSINGITYDQLATYIDYERRLNTTGESVYRTLLVDGDLIVGRLNGFSWPTDILLKSIARTPPIPPGHPGANHLQLRRIYSPVIFLAPNSLEVNHELLLKGPVSLEGRLNGVNLTEFARHSVTLGDKELLSGGRPLRNKVFLGGLTVLNELRAPPSTLIDGVNFEEMLRRVVTIRPIGDYSGRPLRITSPKVFLSDVLFSGPIDAVLYNGMLLDPYLARLQSQQQPQHSNRFTRSLVPRDQLVGIRYEHFDKNSGHLLRQTPATNGEIELLRRLVAPLESGSPDVVVGFIDSSTVQISHLRELEEPLPSQYNHSKLKRQFDQFDYNPLNNPISVYHLAVGIGLDRGSFETQVSSYTGESEHNAHISPLPVEAPNSARFLEINKALFLLVSQDYTTFANQLSGPQCPSELPLAPYSRPSALYTDSECGGLAPGTAVRDSLGHIVGGIHVYIFEIFGNSSYFRKTSFELFQTIDLHDVDSMEPFTYKGSQYVAAVSRMVNKIYLLLLRGYTGFQIVSHIDVPQVERVQVLYDVEERPMLVIYLTSGLRKLMEPIIV